MGMDLDKVIAEGDRLLDVLSTLDPTEAADYVIDPKTGKTRARKSKYEQVQDYCIKWMQQVREENKAAQENLNGEYKRDIESERLEVDKMKLTLDMLKAQADNERSERKDRMEDEHWKDQKEQNDRKIDLDEAEFDFRVVEAQEQKKYSRGQAAWEIGKIILKGAIDGLLAVGTVKAIGNWETKGVIIGGTKAKTIPFGRRS